MLCLSFAALGHCVSVCFVVAKQHPSIFGNLDADMGMERCHQLAKTEAYTECVATDVEFAQGMPLDEPNAHIAYTSAHEVNDNSTF